MKFGKNNPSYRDDLDKKLKLLTIEDIINLKYSFKDLENMFKADSRTIKKRLSNKQIILIKKNQYIKNREKQIKYFKCKLCSNKFLRQKSGKRYFCSDNCVNKHLKNIYIRNSEYMKNNNPMFNLESVKKMFATHYKFDIKKKSSYEKRFENNINQNNLVFCGDGKIWLKNMCPDYRIISQKKCIEIISEYYDRNEEYAKIRIKKANDVDWHCLIIFLAKTNKKTNFNKIQELIYEFEKNNFSGWIDIDGKINKN